MRRVLILLILVLVTSGCIQFNNASLSNQDPFAQEEARNSVLELKDVRGLEFYENVEPSQGYEADYEGKISGDNQVTENRLRTSSFTLMSEDSLFGSLGAKDVPVIISSAVNYYNNSGQAVKNLEEIVEEEKNYSGVEEYRRTGSGRMFKIKPDTGSNLTVIYSRQRNVILSAMTGTFGDYKEEETRQIIEKMRQKLKKE